MCETYVEALDLLAMVVSAWNMFHVNATNEDIPIRLTEASSDASETDHQGHSDLTHLSISRFQEDDRVLP